MKQSVVIVCAVMAVIAAAVFFFPGYEYSAGSEEQRQRCIEQYGWKIEPSPAEQAEVEVPEVFDNVHEEYNKLQKAAGFDLSDYCGKTAVRYTYKVLNHRAGEDVYANILVYENKMIAADIMSRGLEGFMHEICRKEYK